MNNKTPRIIIENQQRDFLYEKSKSNLNITFNRISFIFFIFFIIFLIYSIHLIHLGTQKIKVDEINYTKKTTNKLAIIDASEAYLKINAINNQVIPKTIPKENEIAIISPRYIATPFPPLNFNHTVNI